MRITDNSNREGAFFESVYEKMKGWISEIRTNTTPPESELSENQHYILDGFIEYVIWLREEDIWLLCYINRNPERLTYTLKNRDKKIERVFEIMEWALMADVQPPPICLEDLN